MSETDDVIVAQSSPARARSAHPAAPPEDLSLEIARTIEKSAGDHVRCTRVFGDSYRCNWWAAEGTVAYDNPGMGGLIVTTHRVRRSRFLHVVKTPSGLVITERPGRNGSELRGGDN